MVNNFQYIRIIGKTICQYSIFDQSLVVFFSLFFVVCGSSLCYLSIWFMIDWFCDFYFASYSQAEMYRLKTMVNLRSLWNLHRNTNNQNKQQIMWKSQKLTMRIRFLVLSKVHRKIIIHSINSDTHWSGNPIFSILFRGFVRMFQF